MIINWLLTRRCNLKCDYCNIIKDPDEYTTYPTIKELIENERSVDDYKSALSKFKLYHPDAFHIFYGGEPTMYNGINQIAKHCFDNDIHHTIITNGTNLNKLKEIFSDCGNRLGLTISIDPLEEHMNPKAVHKYMEACKCIEYFMGKLPTLMCETTLTYQNIEFAEALLKKYPYVNFILNPYDIAKTKMYDFASDDPKYLLHQNEYCMNIYKKLITYDNVYMKDTNLYNNIMKHLPYGYDCGINHLYFNNNVNTLSFDADGKMRLCLRIRGILSPDVDMNDIFIHNGEFNSHIFRNGSRDYFSLCKKCMWTCPMMCEQTSNHL